MLPFGQVTFQSKFTDLGVPDLPLEIVLTVAAGILVLLFVCIIALCVRWKLKGQHDVNNQAIYNQGTVSSSGGYATTKPHTRSSWTCTYKAGSQHQVDTHIWETPLPEPSADEYTLPTNMRQGNSQIPPAMLYSMEYTKPISSMDAKHDAYNFQDEYTQPVKVSDAVSLDIGMDGPMPAPGHASMTVSNNRSSQNYCYYDPSASSYMEPASTSMSSVVQCQNDNGNNSAIPKESLPVQETMNPVYKTLIRMKEVPH